MERNPGTAPESPAWQAGVITFIRNPQIKIKAVH